jgi:hypothetical protein
MISLNMIKVSAQNKGIKIKKKITLFKNKEKDNRLEQRLRPICYPCFGSPTCMFSPRLLALWTTI